MDESGEKRFFGVNLVGDPVFSQFYFFLFSFFFSFTQFSKCTWPVFMHLVIKFDFTFECFL